LVSHPFKLTLVTALLVITTPAFARLGEAARGTEIYAKNCSACHSLDANRAGPAHRGVYGRKAGSAAGYGYSASVATSRIIWNGKSLNRWLTNPQATIPGSRMGFRLPDPQKRADVIAYLRSVSERP
jgi:cytochrome c